MKKSQLRKIAADKGITPKRVRELLKSGDLLVVDEETAGFQPEAAETAEREDKVKRWAARLAPFGVDYVALSKAERKEYRARWRADRALGRLEKAIGGSTPKVSDGRVRGDLIRRDLTTGRLYAIGGEDS